ncbi:MAG: glutaminase A [Chthoniobacteraceae bacterium]
MSQRPNPPTCQSPILSHLGELHAQLARVEEGAVATYIPELAKADPKWFGICVVTANGGVYEVGDSRQPFTMQSVSKPFVYGLALEDRGRVEVLEKIGVEPTGDAFNSISLEPTTGRPRNPMINAGAIAATGLIEGLTPRVQLDRIIAMFSLYAGRTLTIDDAVYRSESETGHRNRAIGHMLRNSNILSEDPADVLELYFKQCSVLANCYDLAVMAATLANRGVNPLTGKQAIRGEYVESVLGVMGTCGMYDYAGEWLYDVGLPAKSGVSGGVIAVLPGQLGIGVFSPRLDDHGNSIRGVQVCNALSRHWDLHLFNRPGIGRSSIRVRSDATQFNSSRVHTITESRALREHGSAIQLYQLQGNLVFSVAELVVRELTERAAEIESVILDFKRVLTVNESACRLFAGLLTEFADAGKHVLLAHTDYVPPFRRYLKLRLGDRFAEVFHSFDDADSALEWCENRLLARVLPTKPAIEIRPRDYDLLSGLTDDEVAIVAARFRRCAHQAGEVIIKEGDNADELYLLASGQVSVTAQLDSGRRKRLATFSAGMAFGEMALLDRAPRSATIVADTAAECDLLSLKAFTALGETHPRIKIQILENLARVLSRKLRKANRDLTALE